MLKKAFFLEFIPTLILSFFVGLVGVELLFRIQYLSVFKFSGIELSLVWLLLLFLSSLGGFCWIVANRSQLCINLKFWNWVQAVILGFLGGMVFPVGGWFGVFVLCVCITALRCILRPIQTTVSLGKPYDEDKDKALEPTLEKLMTSVRDGLEGNKKTSDQDKVFALVGPNGVGKTEVLKRLPSYLEKKGLGSSKGYEIKFLQLDRFDSKQAIIESFFSSIADVVKTKGFYPGVFTLSGSYMRLFSGVMFAFPFFSIPISIFHREKDFDALNKKANKLLEMAGIKLVIVLDELDRCSSVQRSLIFQMLHIFRGIQRVVIILSGSAQELFRAKISKSDEEVKPVDLDKIDGYQIYTKTEIHLEKYVDNFIWLFQNKELLRNIFDKEVANLRGEKFWDVFSEDEKKALGESTFKLLVDLEVTSRQMIRFFQALKADLQTERLRDIHLYDLVLLAVLRVINPAGFQWVYSNGESFVFHKFINSKNLEDAFLVAQIEGQFKGAQLIIGRHLFRLAGDIRSNGDPDYIRDPDGIRFRRFAESINFKRYFDCGSEGYLDVFTRIGEEQLIQDLNQGRTDKLKTACDEFSRLSPKVLDLDYWRYIQTRLNETGSTTLSSFLNPQTSSASAE